MTDGDKGLECLSPLQLFDLLQAATSSDATRPGAPYTAEQHLEIPQAAHPGAPMLSASGCFSDVTSPIMPQPLQSDPTHPGSSNPLAVMPAMHAMHAMHAMPESSEASPWPALATGNRSCPGPPDYVMPSETWQLQHAMGTRCAQQDAQRTQQQQLNARGGHGEQMQQKDQQLSEPVRLSDMHQQLFLASPYRWPGLQQQQQQQLSDAVRLSDGQHGQLGFITAAATATLVQLTPSATQREPALE